MYEAKQCDCENWITNGKLPAKAVYNQMVGLLVNNELGRISKDVTIA
jgi:hypothetical protein